MRQQFIWRFIVCISIFTSVLFLNYYIVDNNYMFVYASDENIRVVNKTLSDEDFSEVEKDESDMLTDTVVKKDITITPIRVPVLMYHHVDSEISNSAVVSPRKFKSDMTTLKDAGYTAIFLSELKDYLDGKTKLGSKPIIITFDDGYYSNYEYAYPIVKELDMKINISIIGWSVGRSTFIGSEEAIIPHFTWDELGDMSRSGFVEIQNHTFDLHSLKGISYGRKKDVNIGMTIKENEKYIDYKNRLIYDFLGLEEGILNYTGKKAQFLAYPYGAYNEDSEKALKELNYKGSLTVKSGVREFKSLDDLWLIPRINVSEDLSGDLLIKKIDKLSSN